MIHLFKVWIAQQWIKSSLGFSVQRYVLQSFVSKKKERKKESPCLHSDISKKKQGMFGMMSPEIKLLLWQVWHDGQMEQNFLPTPENKNSDVEVNNKYKETKEICPSESKYVHHLGWELRHGNLWWQASQRILRPYCFIYKAPKVFLLVSEYRIRRDTLNCWQE